MDEERDDGRPFVGLDAREAQQALAGEFDPVTDGAEPFEDIADAEGEGEAGRDAVETTLHVRMAEALLFAAVEPLDESAISARLPEGADIAGVLDALQRRYEGSGVVLSRAAGKYRFVTAPDLAYLLQKEKVEPRKLSRAALETLAIIAYHQPCTRADIEDVRGVAVSPGSLDQLMDIGWIRMRGRRRSAPGRPLLYGTTQAFLEHFNLEAISDLPGMADLKAAGLLDARLPAGFTIPVPADPAGDDDLEDLEIGEDEFVKDFHADPEEQESQG